MRGRYPRGVSVPGLSSREIEATRSFYDRISRAYDLVADASEHEAREKGLELLAAAEGERVLEIGFGTGHALVDLARSVGSGGTVAGVDLSSGMAEVSRRRLHDAGLADRADLRVEAVPPVPFDDSTFDAVFMSFTLELFPDAAIPAVLAESRRVLVRGGRLGVVCLAETGRKPGLVGRAYRWMHRHFPHIFDCRPIDVDRWLGQSGFEVERGTDLEIWTLPVRAVLARRSASS